MDTYLRIWIFDQDKIEVCFCIHDILFTNKYPGYIIFSVLSLLPHQLHRRRRKI